MKHATLFFLWVSLLLAGCASARAAAVPPPVVETGVDPEAWSRIPAGEFLMGQHEHTTLVESDFEMMVTPVTNAQYARYLNEVLAAGNINMEQGRIAGFYPGDPFHALKHEIEIGAGDYLHLPLDRDELRLLLDGGAFQSQPGYEYHPVVMITWFGARAYCEFYGWRLPTEVEWEKAARGADRRPFPWGDTIDGRSANFYGSRDPFEAGVGKQGDTTPVGFYNGQAYSSFATLDAASPYGLYDMAGNVWQWAADVYEGQHYRYLRGGSKADYGYNLRVWTRNSAAPDYASPNVGFRCARSTGD